MQPQHRRRLAQAYPDIIVGIKTAHYWTAKPWDDTAPPLGLGRAGGGGRRDCAACR